MRSTGLLAGSDKTGGGLGGVARPFLSDEIPREEGLYRVPGSAQQVRYYERKFDEGTFHHIYHVCSY